MSNTKKIVFCDDTETANKISSNLEGSEAYGEQIFVDECEDSDIKKAARQGGISESEYSIAQLGSSHSS